MDSVLLDMEKHFFDLTYISDRTWLEAVLHADFSELGKSGRLFDRQETIDALLACTKNRDIRIYNFSVDRLCLGCYMVHYVTVDDGDINLGRASADGKVYFYRTSIWLGEEKPQLRYHQASPIVRPDILTFC